MNTRIKLAAAALLVAGSVSSALAAETFDEDLYRANPNAPQATATRQIERNASSAYAYAPPRQRTRVQAPVQPNSNAVYVNGRYIGQDPDANVRLMLQKDFSYQ